MGLEKYVDLTLLGKKKVRLVHVFNVLSCLNCDMVCVHSILIWLICNILG